MTDHPPPRRLEFDLLCNGWGADDLGDLTARCELLMEFWLARGPLNPAELKVARAMTRRLGDLGGVVTSLPQ